MASEEMMALNDKILKCQLCRLAKSRTNAVPGTGPAKVEVVFVGEGPGRNEDLEGKPFVGAGGKLLDELLHNAGLERSLVYVTNVVKCRPPGNRKPLDDEVEICTNAYLEKQLTILKPLLICTLGATALEYFTGMNRMGEAHGKLTRGKNGIALLPTYHPASIFRNQSYKALLQADLMKIPKVLSQLRREEQKQRQTTLTSY